MQIYKSLLPKTKIITEEISEDELYAARGILKDCLAKAQNQEVKTYLKDAIKNCEYAIESLSEGE